MATALLLCGTPTPHELARNQKTFSIGSAKDNDIRIQSDLVSASHCQLRRKGNGLIVIDKGSKNSTFFEEQQDSEFRLTPGKTFTVGARPFSFIVLDDEMRAYYPDLLDIIGSDGEIDGSVEKRRIGEPLPASELLIDAHSTANLLITGRADCDQDRLPRIIHRISKRRWQPLIALDQIPTDRDVQSRIIKHEAERATIVLNLGANSDRVDPGFRDACFSRSYQIRVIVLARTLNVARKALGDEHAQTMKHIAVRPIVDRRGAIHRVLDRMLAEYPSPLRTADLLPSCRDSLLSYGWRQNMETMRDVAEKLATIARCGFSINLAAQVLGMPATTLYGWRDAVLGETRDIVPDSRVRALMPPLRSRT